MDSEDQRYLEMDRISGDRYAVFPKRYVAIRLYERQEINMILQLTDQLVQEMFTKSRRPDDYRFIYEHCSSMFRVQRFFDTLRGFHTGSLDLGGRHRGRYELHLKHFCSFASDYHLVMASTSRNFPLILQAFTEKWRLSSLIPQVWYGTQIAEVSAIMENSSPIFQAICLLDLPQELYDTILSVADRAEVRALGQVCRALRKVSIAYIFKSSVINMSAAKFFFDFDIERFRRISSDEGIACTRVYMEDSITRILPQLGFMLCRTDILRGMQSLHVENEWPSGIQRYVIGDHETFWQPISFAVEEIMGRVNLSRLKCSGLTLTSKMLRTVASMKTLHTVELNGPPFCPSAQEVPPIPSAVNVSLIFDGTADQGLLELLRLFVRVRTAVIRLTSVVMPVTFPGLTLEFAMRCNPFRSLQRLDLMQIPLSSVPKFCTWIAVCASQTNGLQLTHLRLCCGPGLDQIHLMALINSLSTAPLRVLALGGIRYAGLDLIDRLADAFPMLVALTLIRLASGRKFELRPCPWPHATWEYAPRFSQFQHLQHFAWNLRVDAEGGCRIGDLPHIEASCPPVTDVLFPHDMVDDDPRGLRAVGKLFMAHCQSLRRLDHISGSDILRTVDTHERAGSTVVLYFCWKKPMTWQFFAPDEYYPCSTGRTHSWYF